MAGNELGEINKILVFPAGHQKQFTLIINKTGFHRRVLEGSCDWVFTNDFWLICEECLGTK